MVGAAYATDNIGKLETWARALTKLDVARFLNINPSTTGFVNTERFHDYLNENIASDDDDIEDLKKVYAAVTTDLETGREVWLSRGSLVRAVWASMALPGLFPAVRHDNSWLVDGGLVNPVPVSTCRALGADIVIAVNLNGDIVGKHFEKAEKNVKDGVSGKLTELVKEYTNLSFFEARDNDPPPGMLNAIAASINITQDRLTRSRMAGDPPDIVFSPKLADIGLLELYRANEAIAEGERCVQRQIAEIEYVLARS
jgi:NTE family protein